MTPAQRRIVVAELSLAAEIERELAAEARDVWSRNHHTTQAEAFEAAIRQINETQSERTAA